jgi:pyruvate dehydrogenase E2 component (dihydrolipoamide acetyltransferase)
MAQVTLTTEVDAFELHKLHLGWPRSGDGQSDSRPTYTDIFVKVVADLLGAHPLLNSTLEEDLIKVIEEINIGVAVAAETGLIVPVVKDADKKKVSEISAALRALVDKSKTGGLGMDDVMGGTFTITNLGRYDVDAFTPIINPPQAAILGVGRIVERPTVRDGKVVVGPTLVLSLTFDHRVMDGHVAATFLKALKQALENPDGLRALLRLEG